MKNWKPYLFCTLLMLGCMMPETWPGPFSQTIEHLIAVFVAFLCGVKVANARRS